VPASQIYADRSAGVKFGRQKEAGPAFPPLLAMRPTLALPATVLGHAGVTMYDRNRPRADVRDAAPSARAADRSLRYRVTLLAQRLGLLWSRQQSYSVAPRGRRATTQAAPSARAARRFPAAGPRSLRHAA